MKITPLFPRRPTAVLMMSLLASLTACGGGGGGSGSSTTSQAASSAPADTTPDAFTAASVTNAELHTEITSATITVTGINQATPISISGGTYSISGGAYTDAAGTVTNGQTVTVKVTSSDKTNTAVSATLTVGGVSGQFTVTTAPDLVPDGFSFTALTGVTPNSVNTSDSITLAGVDTAVPISITGGEYAIDNGTYTNAAGTVSSGQKIAVRLTASDKTNTATSATLTIGGVSGQFTVTTAPDVTPDAFSFAPVNNVVPGSVNISAPITVAGVDVAVPISVSGGEYSIDNGAYTSTAGTVSSGQSVKVRATASNATTTDVTAALTIGGVSANYKITTLADTQAPTAQILFPPPASMTEGNTILVRGTASDDYSTITSVKVNGVTATTNDGFKNWQALVPLADSVLPLTKETDNTIAVTTEDFQGNKSADAAHITIRQGTADSHFPSDNITFHFPYGLALDKANGTNRVLLTDTSNNIYSIDLSSGARTIFATIPQCASNAVAIDSLANRLYTVCSYGSVGKLFDINLAAPSQINTHTDSSYNGVLSLISVPEANSSKVVTVSDSDGSIVSSSNSFTTYNVLSSAVKPDGNNQINHSWGIAYDSLHQRYLVSDYSQQSVFAVDAATGARTIFSSNTVGTGPHFGGINSFYLSGITIDESRRQALVVEALSGNLFAINLDTGNRELLSSVTPDNPFNSLEESYYIVIVDPNSYALVAANTPVAVFAVDMITGHRVIYSK